MTHFLSGSPNHTTVTVSDETDVPRFAFAESRYSVTEPNSTVSAKIVRYGDVSEAAKIYCVTSPGSAVSGRDFVTRSASDEATAVYFKPGEWMVTLRLCD